MIWATTVVAALLATGAQAGILSLVAEGMSRNSPALERRLEEIAKANIQRRGGLAALMSRQTTTGMGSMTFTSNTPLNADGSINMAAWEQMTSAACEKALQALPAASNPSGTCACYNLPALDATTGKFEADLRLYKLNDPTGTFAGISQQNIQIGMVFSGASVSPIAANSTTTATTASAAKAVKLKRQQTITAPAPPPPRTLTLLETYMFVGQIDRSRMNSSTMTVATAEALVLPTLVLSAMNPQGQSVVTNVSLNEAAFVTGVFSLEVITSNLTIAQDAVNAELMGLRNGTVAFVLPGVNLLIFPIGLVITSTWLAIGLAAYGAGTMARIGYADTFKRRSQVAQKSMTKEI